MKPDTRSDLKLRHHLLYNQILQKHFNIAEWLEHNSRNKTLNGQVAGANMSC